MTFETLKIVTMDENPNLNYLYKNNVEIHEIIPKVYKRYYVNIGKIKIENLYFNFLSNFNKIAKEIQYASTDIKFYLTYIDHFFDDLNSKLTIHDSKDIENLNAIIRICEIVMEESIEQNDMDCLFQSIIQLESKIRAKNLINQWDWNEISDKMHTIKFEINRKQFENRMKIHANKDIVALVNIILNNEICISLVEDIKTLFYIQTKEKLDEIIEETKKLYSGEELEIINRINNCFKSLLISKLSLDNIRGGFLELFVYAFLNKKYPKNEIFKEVKVKYGSFTSNLSFDIVVDFNNNQYNAYECKFSPKYIKRKHIDNLSSLRKIENIFPYLVVFENILMVKHEIMKLREDTKKNEFNKLLKDFEIISLEDFKRGYFYNT